MRIDTAKIDEKIKRLQDLKRIASDPEMVRLLLETVSDNSVETQPNRSSPRTSRKRGGTKKGELAQAVKKAVASINHAFTADTVVSWMQTHDYIFTAKDPKIAVNGVLRKMAKKQQLKIVKAGSGRVPNEYEKAQRSAGE